MIKLKNIISTIPNYVNEILPSMTIDQVKINLNNWLQTQGFKMLGITLLFNDNTALTLVIFTTNNYDNVNFLSREKTSRW